MELTNLQGSVVAIGAISAGATGPSQVFQTTEFGQPRTGALEQTCEWFGARGIQTDQLTGYPLMAPATSQLPEPERMMALAAEYGIEILGPPGVPS